MEPQRLHNKTQNSSPGKYFTLLLIILLGIVGYNRYVAWRVCSYKERRLCIYDMKEVYLHKAMIVDQAYMRLYCYDYYDTCEFVSFRLLHTTRQITYKVIRILSCRL